MIELPGAGALAWRSPQRIAGSACVFLDRDGVLNERIVNGYVLSWDDFRWRPDAFAAQRTIAQAGLPAVVVSNQSCIGRGILGVETLIDIMHHMTEELASAGVPLAAWYCCPHAPDAGCDCRKPRPGMILRAIAEFGFDPKRSHMIGDTQSDIDAGTAAGCTSHLIDTADPNAFARAVAAITSHDR